QAQRTRAEHVGGVRTPPVQRLQQFGGQFLRLVRPRRRAFHLLAQLLPFLLIERRLGELGILGVLGIRHGGRPRPRPPRQRTRQAVAEAGLLPRTVGLERLVAREAVVLREFRPRRRV